MQVNLSMDLTPIHKAMNHHPPATAEQRRLEEVQRGEQPWRQWGGYLSERQWGCVREDYSPGGTAWDYLPHDHARSRAYRWGEDGLGGICDDHGQLCLAVALWNERDPILKERLFGLNNSEGNHGEDVKECYWYLDALPTHSYLKMLYKYPQREFPYNQLVEENRRRTKLDPEFEILDTGVFDDDRYFDVVVEYAKASPRDVLMHITITNRGPESARLHVLPQLWFRNIWSWRPEFNKPSLAFVESGAIAAEHYQLGNYHWYIDGARAEPSPSGRGQVEGAENNAANPLTPALSQGERENVQPELLFCDNDTNVRRLFGQTDAQGFFKDAFHEYLIRGNHAAVNPAQGNESRGALCPLDRSWQISDNSHAAHRSPIKPGV